MTRLARLDIYTRLRQRIASAPFAELTVVRIGSGSKRIDNGADSVEVATGQYLAVASGQLLNIENIPAPAGVYAASCLSILSDLPYPRADLPPRRWARLSPNTALDQAFAHAEQGLRETLTPTLLRYRVGELLEALAFSGFMPVPREGEPTAERLRMLLATAPGDDWRAEDVAARLAMSAATLRRRLAAEHSGFRAVLEEVRLSHALALVQGSAQPLKWVALECGYQSASRFAERFRERFGCLPSELRGEENPAARDGLAA
jgi:AraC-like DNA-binding protein